MPYRNKWVIAIFVLVVCAAGFWLRQSLQPPKPYQETQFLLDTVIEITAYGPDAEPAVKAAFAEFKRIQKLSDRFDDNSQITAVNRAAGRQAVKVDPDVLAMLQEAKGVSAKVDGAFDVTIGALTDLWGIGHKGEFVPTAAEIEAVLPLVDYRQIVLDEAAQTAYLPRAGMQLDIGGIGKGYAIDKAAAVLAAHGVKSALINAGGDVRAIGNKPDGNPWRIGVQHPRQSDGMIAKLALSEWDTMETSGDYQRYFMKDGVRYAHILDPKTGQQPRELASVTLVYRAPQAKDIASSAFMVLGLERSLEMLKRFPGVEAIFVTAEGRVVVTPGLSGKVELVQ